MAEEAVTAGSAPSRHIFSLTIALGCAAVAYFYLGAPGLGPTALSALLPVSDGATGWFPAMHLLATSAILAGAAWLSETLRRLPKPGLIPLAGFAAFQYGLIAVALTNLAIASGGLRAGGATALTAAFYVLPAIAAFSLHPNLYMTVLRFRGWAHSMTLSAHGPLTGGALVVLTVAANLVPLALTFQSLTTHSGAQLSALFRGAVIDPEQYSAAIWAQTTTVTAFEMALAGGAFALSVALGALWAGGRGINLGRATSAQKLANSLSEPQLRFVDDALPAALDAVTSRASQKRFVAWAFFWSFAVAPLFLGAGYIAFRWFDVLQERQALSWTTNAASDLEPFATGEAGIAHIAIPVAAVLFVLLMGGPLARSFLRGARYDQLAFSEPLEDTLRARLLAGVAKGTLGPGQPFDPAAFAVHASAKRSWISISLVLLAVGFAAVTGFRDLARGVAFTGDGVIVQEHYFAPPSLVRYHEVLAVSLDCRVSPLGGKPVYELTLPGGRVVDMIGDAPLRDRLDQYINVDQRLQFSGVGYAYPPAKMDQCLTAIQKQTNSMIAAGTARLLHVLD